MLRPPYRSRAKRQGMDTAWPPAADHDQTAAYFPDLSMLPDRLRSGKHQEGGPSAPQAHWEQRPVGKVRSIPGGAGFGATISTWQSR